MAEFKLTTEYAARGDQPRAIEELTAGVLRGDEHQVLLGVTGSGKTFTMANVIANAKRPALIIAHNKTLAAQLYGEFKQLFPENAVEYFVSYYDYYQPEAYVPSSDTYIEKDSSINEQIERMRHEYQVRCFCGKQKLRRGKQSSSHFSFFGLPPKYGYLSQASKAGSIRGSVVSRIHASTREASLAFVSAIAGSDARFFT
jgi:hypothetical protein